MTESTIDKMNDVLNRFARGESPETVAFQSNVTRFEMIEILHWQWDKLNKRFDEAEHIRPSPPPNVVVREDQDPSKARRSTS